MRNQQTAFGLYVFYRNVEDVARSGPFGPSILLGMVVTHELGHYFGLDDGHRGVMLSTFSRRETMMHAASGRLTFDRKQAAHLRRPIAKRRTSHLP